MDGLEVASTQELKASPTFPLQNLAMELQLRILQHILVSPIPILNADVPQTEQVFVIKGEEKGQDQINPNMIFTCKLFYTEGLPLLYGHNTFTYTRESQIRGYVFYKCAYGHCLRCAKSRIKGPLYHPWVHYEGGYPCFGNGALANRTTNLNLRVPLNSNIYYDCNEVAWHVNRFTSLKTLQLDFLQYPEMPLDYYGVSLLHNSIEKVAKHLRDPSRSTGTLSLIVLTGLSYTDYCLEIVKQFAKLLAPDGRMGIGCGSRGKQFELLRVYDCNDDGEVVKRNDLELVWMTASEVKDGALDRMGTWHDENHSYMLHL